MRADTETAQGRPPETAVESAPGSAVGAAGSGRRVAGLIGAGIALLACCAYGFGWIGETSLLFVVVGFVIYARATMGWFG